MKAGEERLAFAVDLAQEANFNTRLNDWRRRLEAFFDLKKGAPRGFLVMPAMSNQANMPEYFSPEEFISLGKRANEVLRGLTNTHRKNVSVGMLDSIELQKTTLSILPVGNNRIILAEASTPDAFMLDLALLLEPAVESKVLKCAAPDCDQLFYRSRRQLYCSTRCRNRSLMREERKSKSYRAAEREKAAQRYAKNIKEREHREVKRRPQKLRPPRPA